MKKTFGFFAILAVSLLGIISCQKEVEQVERPAAMHTLKFVADAPLTKTTAVIGDKVVDYKWTKNDENRFTVYEIASGVYKAADETIGILNDDGTMSILASFKGSYVSGSQYVALLNNGVQASQSASGSAYDELSDVLISEKVTSGNIDEQELKLRFKRETAFALMTAKGLTEGVNIVGASLTSDQTLAAEYDVEKEAFKENGVKTISVYNDGNAVSVVEGGNGNIFFATTPITEAHITVGVVTGDAEGKFAAAYEKKIADDRSISFENGNVRPFNIGVSQVTEQVLDLSIDETTTATENELSWDRTFVSVIAAKAESQTPANNYYPGTPERSYTATRFYKNSKLTVTPKLGLSIKEIVYEATTEGYAAALVNSTWTNATASAARETVTIVPVDGAKGVSAVIGATTGATSIKIKYGIPVQPTAHTVTIDPNIEHGSVTANPSSAVMPGTVVELTATPDDNYTFESWNVTAGDEEVTVAENKFSMPNADVVVSATFKEKQGGETEASFIFDTDAGLAALGISKPETGAGTELGTNVYVSGAIEMTATDGSSTATRVWNSSGATTLRVYKNGSLTFSGATISKIAFTGSSLNNQEAKTGSYSNSTWTGSASSVTFTATGSVTIKTITITYTGGGPVVDKYTVSCATVEGGTLSANPGRAEKDAVITLTATPDEGFEFNNDWVVKDASENPIAVTEGKFTMPASNVNVTGSFTKKTYAITANPADNGTYTVKVGETEVTSASKGDRVTLEASPAEGYLCNGWTVKETVSGDDVSVSNNAFNMPAAAVTITTSFSKKPDDIQYDHAGTESDPYSVQDVLKFISTLGTETSKNDVYTKGIISSIDEVSTKFGNATYTIKDAGTDFEVTVYRGKYIGGAAFISTDQIAIGDEVVVKGKVKDHRGTKEFDTDNQIVSIKKAPYLKASASKTSVAAAGETVTITVDTNIEGWTVKSDNAAFVVGTKSGNTVPVKVSENTSTTDERTAKITVSATGVDDVVITLTQSKASGGGGETKTWTYEVVQNSSALNESSPVTVNEAKWTIVMGDKVGSPSANGSPTKYDGTYGWKWGESSSKYWKTYTLSTDYFASKKVKSVVVNFLNNGKKTGTMLVKQGNIEIGSESKEFGAAWTDLTANSSQGNGGTLTIQYTVAQASYIHSITVEYYD